MSTKSSKAYNSGDDGRTEFHLYTEAFTDTIHLRLKNVIYEVNGYNDGDSYTTVQIPDDILDELINGLIKIQKKRDLYD